MTNLRWKLWVAASWLAYWLCPDKKALALIQKYGTDMSRLAMDGVKARSFIRSGDKP